jgi:SAM-dependent methyltransferase
MIGTFNIHIKNAVTLLDKKPCFKVGKFNLWLVLLRCQGKIIHGYATRFDGSRQRSSTYEIITKEPIPNIFKKHEIEVTVFEKWDDEKIKEWADSQYWFQSFDWGPKRADSKLVWDAINTVDWKNKKVLDIGCNYGYFSFHASKEGAFVDAVDTNKNTLNVAKTIGHHIEMQDVNFFERDLGGEYDYIFYLSVHHQFDPQYKVLKKTIDDYLKRTRKSLFVEMLMPPDFGKGINVDEVVGGKKLLTYKHKVRCTRSIYRIDK